MGQHRDNKRVLNAVRAFITSIGYPQGAFSWGGLDEQALVAFVLQQRDEAVVEYQDTICTPRPKGPSGDF